MRTLMLGRNVHRVSGAAGRQVTIVPGRFACSGRSEAEIWPTDPGTLRDVPLDRAVVKDSWRGARHWNGCGSCRCTDGTRKPLLKDASCSQIRRTGSVPCPFLAHAYQRQYRWHKAAKLQEEALRLADTPSAKPWCGTRSAGASSTKQDTATPQPNSNGPATCTEPLAGTDSPRSPGRP